MRVACIKCSTVYELDDRLIPPSGTSVQCTRCGSVFMAKSGPAAKPSAGAKPQTAVPPQRSGTQIFGAVTADRPATSGAPRAGTQIFGSPIAGAPPAATAKASGGASVATAFPRPAPVAGKQTPGVAGGRPGTPVFDSLAPPASRGTQIFGSPFVLDSAASPVAAAPGASTSAPPPPTGDGPVHAAGDPAPRDAASTVKLPPEEPPWMAGRPQRSATLELPAAKPLFDGSSPDASASVFETEVSGQRRLLFVAALIALLAIPAFFGARAVLKRRSAVPAEVVMGEEKAMTLLRRDDRSSRKQAIADLESLVKKYPSAVSPAAARLLALSLDWDDVHVAVSRLQQQSDELKRVLSRAEAPKTTESDVQLAAAHNQLAATGNEMQPLVDELKVLDGQVAASFKALLTLLSGPRNGSEDLGAIRAQAVYYGVKGVDKAEQLARSYRELGGSDGWDAVALAEYAVNALVAPALVGEARAGNERLRSTDSAFLRSYVLAARLAFVQKDYEAASSLLDAVVALNPSHELARQLIGWADEAKRSEATRSVQAVGDPSVKRQ